MVTPKLLKTVARVFAIATLSTLISSCSSSVPTLSGKYQFLSRDRVLVFDFLDDQRVTQELFYRDETEPIATTEAFYVVTKGEDDFYRIKFYSRQLLEGYFFAMDDSGAIAFAKESGNLIFFDANASSVNILKAVD